jgi:SAM-dependent methyltransferase
VADVWTGGAAYEGYVGRWSRLVAAQFLGWLDLRPGGQWLDVGCGTGALSETILGAVEPREVVGIDPSEAYVAHASQHLADGRARFQTGDAQALPFNAAAYDAAVAGLVLNFVPDPSRAVAEMARVVRPGGVVAVYVWDYGHMMQLMRYFWDAAVALNPAAVDLDEGRRFPICKPEPLGDLFRGAGLQEVQVRSIDVATRFVDFDDYWSPFLGGQGPAPSYAMSLSKDRRADLRERIRSHLPIRSDGSIHLISRAWAVRGTR